MKYWKIASAVKDSEHHTYRVVLLILPIYTCRPYVVYGRRLRTYNDMCMGETHTNRTAMQNPPDIYVPSVRHLRTSFTDV